MSHSVEILDGINDGGKRVDFILVYDSGKRQRQQENETAETKESEIVEDDNNSKDGVGGESEGESEVSVSESGLETITPGEEDGTFEMREEYVLNLIHLGLSVELDEVDGVLFYKINVPWETMTKCAEVLHMKMPIANSDMVAGKGPFTHFCQRIYSCLDYDRNILPDIPYNYTIPFTQAKESSFLVDETDKENFFSRSQQQLAVELILSRAIFEDVEGNLLLRKKGILRLLSMGVFTAAVPLHEGWGSTGTDTSNMRNRLYDAWVMPHFKLQPLDHIRSYFGEKIGFYFCWLDFNTKMLVPACVVGIIVFITNLILLYEYPPTRVSEICDKNGPGNLTICPLCKLCETAKLHDFCNNAKSSAVFDSSVTAGFGLFMAIWSILFVELWKRVENRLRVAWHVSDIHDTELEDIRPQCFNAIGLPKTFNEVTDQLEPRPRKAMKYLRIFVSELTMLLMICIVVASALGILLFRVALTNILRLIGTDERTPDIPIIVSIASGFINLFIIILYDSIYDNISYILTDVEMPRTQTEWDNSYIAKSFIFDFITNNFVLLYLAFFKGNFTGSPGAYRFLFDIRLENPGPEGNMFHICIMLCVLMIGKNLHRSILEKYASRATANINEKSPKQWVTDYQLRPVPENFLIRSYIDMITYYGFVAMFAVAFPLAPVIALIINIIHIRFSANSLIVRWRKPSPKRARGIGGIWIEIIQHVSLIAVITNATILTFSSELIPEIVHRWNYADQFNGITYTNFTYSAHNSYDTTARANSTPEKTNIQTCFFKGFRNPHWGSTPYEFSSEFWQVATIRLLFGLVFVWLAFTVAWVLANTLGMPPALRRQVTRERHLAQEVVIRPGKYENLTLRYKRKRTFSPEESTA